ncbi:MAG: HNH endonuclease [Bryobacterales bacterium]|nr:HNH endonuclease [Bryobacterales bacterium]
MTFPNRSATRDASRIPCAFCGVPLTSKNRTKEHVLPNAIGGRKTVDNFICSDCNHNTGTKWDAKLVEQLRPLCTMLNVNRSRGQNREFDVETVSGRKLSVKRDGSIHARTMPELRKILSRLKKKYTQIDLDEVLKRASPKQEYLSEPYGVSLTVGGSLAGRAIVKSCLAMVYDAGVEIGCCDDAESYLLKEGTPCFGYYYERDVVSNRPEKAIFHCIYVSGDPKKRQLLAYVEYFSWLRIVVCLSQNYDGPSISHCYAVDPVTGKDLELDVVLTIEPDEIPEIYDYKKVNYDEIERALNAVMETWSQMDSNRARSHAIQEALDFACRECGISEGDVLTDEQVVRFTRVIVSRLEPFLEHMIVGSKLTEDDLRAIARKSRGRARQ